MEVGFSLPSFLGSHSLFDYSIDQGLTTQATGSDGRMDGRGGNEG